MIYFTLQFGINEQEEKNFRVFYLKVNKIKKKYWLAIVLFICLS